MQEHKTPPNKSLTDEPGKGSILQDASTFIRHINELAEEPLSHANLLDALLEQVTPIDFELAAFPQVEAYRNKAQALEKEICPDGEILAGKEEQQTELKSIQDEIKKFIVKETHLLVISIEKLQEAAIANNWGLCKSHDFIYLYDGCYWQQVDNNLFAKFLGMAAEKMQVAKFKARFYGFRDKLYKQFLSAAYLAKPEQPVRSVFVNLKNGTFEICETRQYLRPFNANDFITYQLPFNYLPGAEAPQFQKYLDKVLPDVTRQKVLAEYIGSLFIKPSTLKLEKALILYGGGANGKSVFYEVINALLGSENVTSYSLQNLTDEHGYYRAKISDKLLNYASEINGKLEAAIFKQLVSGEPVSARLPYGHPFTLKQYAKLIFNCNELPKDIEYTTAFFRRFLIVPFDVTIPPNEQDKTLSQKIIANELPGVFNWVLNGLNRLLQAKQFTDCAAASNALAEYERESDSVRMFIDEENYEASADNYILIKTLYSEYRNYCTNDGYKPVSKKIFSKRLKVVNIQLDRKNTGNVAFVYKRKHT